MPRKASGNSKKLTLCFPPEVMKAAETEAARVRKASPGNTCTPSEVLRMAIIRGMEIISREAKGA